MPRYGGCFFRVYLRGGVLELDRVTDGGNLNCLRRSAFPQRENGDVRVSFRLLSANRTARLCRNRFPRNRAILTLICIALIIQLLVTFDVSEFVINSILMS